MLQFLVVLSHCPRLFAYQLHISLHSIKVVKCVCEKVKVSLNVLDEIALDLLEIAVQVVIHRVTLILASYQKHILVQPEILVVELRGNLNKRFLFFFLG